MLDRRQSVRDKVMYGGVAEIGERGATRECIVRNISDNGASVEFSNVVKLPERADIAAHRAQGPLLPRQGDLVARQFRRRRLPDECPSEPVSDLEERLRKSEIKKRQLQRRINELLGRALNRLAKRPMNTHQTKRPAIDRRPFRISIELSLRP